MTYIAHNTKFKFFPVYLERMGRMTLETCRRVVNFSRLGMHLKPIQHRLAEEGISVSRTSLCLLLKKYQETGMIIDRVRPWSQGKKLQLEHLRLIDEALDKMMKYQMLICVKCCRRRLGLSFRLARFNALKTPWLVTTYCTCKGTHTIVWLFKGHISYSDSYWLHSRKSVKFSFRYRL